MVGLRPGGRPWTRAEDKRLQEMLEAETTVVAITKKLKRTPGTYSPMR
jgi:hypothetical protein